MNDLVEWFGTMGVAFCVALAAVPMATPAAAEEPITGLTAPIEDACSFKGQAILPFMPPDTTLTLSHDAIGWREQGPAPRGQLLIEMNPGDIGPTSLHPAPIVVSSFEGTNLGLVVLFCRDNTSCGRVNDNGRENRSNNLPMLCRNPEATARLIAAYLMAGGNTSLPDDPITVQ